MADASLKGRLLVAQPALRDPNFERTVVLILEHSEDGAVGVVLNRPGDVDTGDAIPGWSDLAALPRVVFAGGPVVEENAGICLARVRGKPAPGWFTPVMGAVGTLDVSRGREEVERAVEEIRLFAGYAGWGSGQLESELAAGGWFIVDARPVDAFTGDPAGLWAAVLGRQRGQLAWFAHFPPDVTSN